MRTVLDYCNSKEENISLDILAKKGPMEMAKLNAPSTSRPVAREHVPKEQRHIIGMAPTPTIRIDHSSSKRQKLSTALKKCDPIQPSMSFAVEPVLIEARTTTKKSTTTITTRTKTRTITTFFQKESAGPERSTAYLQTTEGPK